MPPVEIAVTEGLGLGCQLLLCPHCLGKRRIATFLDDSIIAHRILRHVGLDPEPRPPPLPGQLEMF